MRRKRKSGRGILILLLIAVLLGVVLFRFVFIVRNVEISGNPGAMSREAVVRAANVSFGKSIFRVDEQKIRSSLNSTGAISCERVSFQYPDTVRIDVRARNRAGMVLHLGRIHVLDEEGYVVESLPQVPNEDMVYVSGMRVQGAAQGEAIRADAAQLSAYCTVIQALRSHSAGIYVSELQLNNAEDMRIITRTGITVELGNARNMADKIAWMKSAVADLERRGERGGTLDVSSGTKADYRSSAN